MDRVTGATPQTRIILSLLRKAGRQGLTGTELLDAGVKPRYSARIESLRKEGCEIRTDRVRASLFRYTLVSTPPHLLPPPKPTVQQCVDGEDVPLFDANELESKVQW